jgi:hypothetical protein
MPASGARSSLAALVGYVCVALWFAWPLTVQLGDALPGPPGGDTGVYVWNLWVFRHEILEHGRFPFFTSEILALSAGAPLTLHNYTSLANIAAFPLLPLIGTVATFNVLVIASGVMSAFAAFVLFRRLSGDSAAAWVGGLLFGFSPFMTARSMAHFSLVQAAALPAFALALDRLRQRPTIGRAAVAGTLVAIAFLCDPYYAVYCLLMAAYAAVWMAVTVERGAPRAVPAALRLGIDFGIVCVAGLVVGIMLRGGGRVEVFGIRVSMTHLYTPMLILTVLVLIRVWLGLQPRISLVPAVLRPHLKSAAVAAATCVLVLSPVLTVMAAHVGERQWIAPRTLWRSSPSGLDVLAFLVPNPTSPWLGWIASGWLSTADAGLIENVASVPWTATFTVAIGLLYAGLRLPRYWVVFTAGSVLLALGPFVQVAGSQTHIPAPWAVLRYLPIVGAARMPTRFSVLVMLGVAALFTVATSALRARARRGWVPVAIVTSCLLLELVPAPRTVHPVMIPEFYDRIAADPRPVRVLTLPFGLRDGTSSYGDYTALTQFYQTVHEKPLIGGYLSRLPSRRLEPYRRSHRLNVLMDLSARRAVSAERMERGIERAHLYPPRLDVGYVIVHTGRVSPQLVSFARAAFDLEFVTEMKGQALYRTPLATGASSRPSKLRTQNSELRTQD